MTGLSISNGAGPESASSQLKGPSDWGVILLCHGSQRGTSARECSCAWKAALTDDSGDFEPPVWCLDCPSTPVGLRDAANRLKDQLGLGAEQVVLSCLEFIEPFPGEAVQALANRGFRRIVLMPYLLGHGKHATLELDEVLEDLQVQTPEAELYLTEGLGSDLRLAELVADRVREMAPHANSLDQSGKPTGILLVKAGTKTQYDDCLWMRELGQMVENRLGPEYAVEIAQSHYGDPTMDDAAACLVEDRGAASITCVPYLFFPGLILQRNVLGGLARLEERYPGLPISATPPLGVDDRLVSVAADRIRDVWQRQAAAT